MKKLLPTLLCLTAPFILSAQVTISTDEYTTEELINTILTNSALIPATNISSSTGINFDSVNGIGYFQKNDSDFPFEKGIILSSGDVLNTAGPYMDEFLSSGSDGWLGDSDIDDIITNSDPIFTSRNASVLEFDFTSFSNTLSLNYMFASNEYGFYQCSPYGRDGIIMLLTDVTLDTPAINIAVVPGTITPVSVATIRNGLYNIGCLSVNSEYFGNYYVTDPDTSPINLRGITVPLTAEASMVPGHTYHLKIAIADRVDTIFDSALFIEAGSLSTGNATSEIQSSLGTILCEGSTTQLIATGNEYFTYQWSYNGEPVSGNTNILEASEPGDYSVIISMPDVTETVTASITITSGAGYTGSVYSDDLIVYEPDEDGLTQMDLSEKQNELESEFAESTITFYETFDDASLNTNSLGTLYTNTSNPQTLYARIENENGCYAITSFNIIVMTVPPPTGEAIQTFTQGQTIADLVVIGQNIKWYNAGSFSDSSPISTAIPLTNDKTYYASQTINDIESKQRLAITASYVAGLNDSTFSAMQYYPNPVKNTITFSNTSNIENITILNLAGQTIIRKEINSTSAQIELSGLSTGIYFAKVMSDGKTKTIKLIKG